MANEASFAAPLGSYVTLLFKLNFKKNNYNQKNIG